MKRFRGIIAPIVTPFQDNGDLYPQGMVNLLEYLAAHGVHGVFAIGSYGSFPLLTEEERMSLAELIVSHCRRLGLKVIVQIGSPSLRTSLRLARHASALAPDAVASVVPFYYSATGYKEDAILNYFAELTKAITVPLHFYNNPRTTGFMLRPQLLDRLIDIGVSGIKDSGSDMANFGEMMNLIKDKAPDFDLMPGSASILLPGFLMGAEACVAGTATAFPALVAELYGAILQEKIKTAIQLQLRVIQARTFQGKWGMRPAACYDILKMRGLDVGTCRAPWRRLLATEYQALQQELSQADLL